MESAPAIGIDLGTTFSAAAVYRNGKCEVIPNKEGHRLTPSFVFYHPTSLEVSSLEMESAPAIGIDLGTTFSAAAVYRNGKCEVIPNKEGHRLTPSFVFYHPTSLEVSVGITADDMGPNRIENFLFDIKRIIGRKYDDVYVQELNKSQEYRYKIVKGENDNAEIQVLHDGLVVCKTPEQVSSEIIKYLKESATEYLGAKVTEAVISVPAYFSNAQRKATRAAAELAGLNVLKLITEPVAAAIHYAEDRLNRKSTLLVFDFGGGTLDVSIIKVDGKSFAVKSVEGDTFLGGRDFDQILLNHFKSAIIRRFGQHVLNDRLLRRIKELCIRLKIKLSLGKMYSLPIYCIGGNEDQHFDMSMTRNEFEHLNQQLISRAKGLLEKCLKEAGLTKEDITDVVLVGGSTRIPKVRDMLSLYFGSQELRTDLNPDEAVALGAGIQAAFLKEKLQELEKYKVTEITPLSLGIGLDGNLMDIVVKKNSPLPVKSDPVSCYTIKNNQKASLFKIFEGERKNCKYNNLLGEFTIHDLPPDKAGEVEFRVVFALNEDGILEVDAHEVFTGKRNKLVVTIGEFRLCDHKIRQTINDAEKNRREDEIFEVYTRYLWKVRRICNSVIYDLNQISSDTNREFVKSKCELFLDVIEKLEYTNLDRLKHAYKTFKNSVKQIVDKIIDLSFSDDEDCTDQAS